MPTQTVARPGPTAGSAPQASSRTRGSAIALTVICAAQLMVVLDTAVVNVAIPSIQRHLHFSTGDLVWVTTAYSLTFGGLLLLGGRSGDLFGRRRMFMVGIAIFSVASLLGGFAQSSIWLVVTRALQGVGGAIASPTALSLITTNFDEGAPRNRAMGVYAAMSGGGAAIGLLLGGILTDLVSWRWVLFVNVPIGVLVLFMAPRVLFESKRISGRLDVRGAVTATLGMVSLVYGLTNAATHSWGAPTTVGPLAAAVVLLSWFILTETRAEHPMLPLRLFANRNRSASNLMMLFVAAAMFAMFYFLTLFLQDVLGYSPLKAGLAFLPAAVLIIFSSIVIAQLIGRVGVRVPLIVGAAMIAGSFAWLTTLTVTSSYLDVLGPLIVLALGMGAIFVPLTVTAVAGVRNEEAGAASALLNTAQQIGGAIGLAALSTIATTAIRDRSHELLASHGGHLTRNLTDVAVTHGYTQAFAVAAGLAVVALLVAVVGIRINRQEIPDATTAPAVG